MDQQNTPLQDEQQSTPQVPYQMQVSANRLPQSPFASLLDDNGGPIFPPADEKFHWGACLLTFIHAVFHRQYKVAGAMLVITIVFNLLSHFIPFVGFLSLPVSIAIMYFYGKIGYRAACLGKEYQSAEELYERERKYTIVGIVVTVLAILLIALAFGSLILLLLMGN